MNTMEVTFAPLTPSVWSDFETLFGKNGACGGCWCMNWLIPKKTFIKEKGEGNRLRMKEYVEEGNEPGIIAYVNGVPAGWCAFAPREKYVRLLKSRVLQPIDDKPVWSVSCFFIAKPFRRQGLSVMLLKEVINYCKGKGADIIEAYPEEPYTGNIPAAFAWKGLPSAFIKAGFTEADRRSKARPIMRYYIRQD